MLMVVDNFFSDPYKIRNMGLKGEYYPSPEFRWPGYRYSNLSEEFKKHYLDKVDSILNQELNLDTLSFQYIDKSWLNGLCHTDYPPFKYTCLTFLNPKPLSNSGTEVYLENPPCGAYAGEDDDDILTQYVIRRGAKEKIKTDNQKENYYGSSKNIIDRWVFNKFKKKYNSVWHDPCIISNRFNRTLIFDSALYHRAQNFFGNNVKDSRLTLIGFFI